MIKMKKLLKEDSVSPSFRQMINLFKNAIPMMFPKEEGKPYDKYYYQVMQNGDVGSFVQALHRGDPKTKELWLKVAPVVQKAMQGLFKELTAEHKKKLDDNNKLAHMLSKSERKTSYYIHEGLSRLSIYYGYTKIRHTIRRQGTKTQRQNVS